MLNIYLGSIFTNVSIRNKLTLLFSCVFLFILIGCRDISVGPDTLSYKYDIYYISKFYSLEYILSDYRYLLSNLIFKLVGSVFDDSYRMILFLFAGIISSTIFWYFKKNSVDPFYSVLLLLVLGHIYFFMAGLKQTLAILAILFAYNAFLNKKCTNFLLSVFIAGLFHPSAFIIFPIVALLYLPVPRIIFLLIPFLSLFSISYSDYIFSLILNNLTGVFTQYGVLYFSENSLSMFYIQLCIFILVVFLLWDKLDSNSMENKFLLIFAIGMLFQSLTKSLAEFSRIALYFSISGATILPAAIYFCSSKFIIYKKFIYWGSILVFVAYFLFFGGKADTYYPYKMFFNELTFNIFI